MPDYAKTTETFGGYGEAVVGPSDIKPSLLKDIDEVRRAKLPILDVILKEP